VLGLLERYRRACLGRGLLRGGLIATGLPKGHIQVWTKASATRGLPAIKSMPLHPRCWVAGLRWPGYSWWWRSVKSISWNRWEISALGCEDIYHGHVQQCHEPVGNSPHTKSTWGRSTRPLHKVSLNQAGPTTIRPDLNNFSAWLLRLTRPGPYNMAHAARFDSAQAFTAGRQTRTIHLTFWLTWSPSTKASPRSLNSFSYLHHKGLKIFQTSKISWAVQFTSLLRFGSLDPILDPTLVLV